MGFHLLRQFCVESPVGCEFRAGALGVCLVVSHGQVRSLDLDTIKS